MIFVNVTIIDHKEYKKVLNRYDSNKKGHMEWLCHGVWSTKNQMLPEEDWLDIKQEQKCPQV